MKTFLTSFVFFFTLNAARCQNLDLPYSGKIMSGKGSCAWLILIEDGPETSWIGKIIEPTGTIPKELLKKRKKVIFNFYPLRQPVSPACKSDIVGSIASIEEK